MILYYITDRRQLPGNEERRRADLLAKIAEAARHGVDFIQLREKDLSPRELLELAREAVRIVRESGNEHRTVTEGLRRRPTLLINSRIDVALAAGADGVHLTASDISASDARAVWAKAVTANPGVTLPSCTIAVSCHTAAEVRLAESHAADFAVFAPVFEKVAAPQKAGVGLTALREACRGEGHPMRREGVGASPMPVLALGGVTLENAAECAGAGAEGIAAIRLFQQNDIGAVVHALRNIQGPLRS